MYNGFYISRRTRLHEDLYDQQAGFTRNLGRTPRPVHAAPRIPFDPGDGKFPVFPPRGDMQNPIYLHRPGHLAALSLHFGSPETTIVMGEVPVGRRVLRDGPRDRLVNGTYQPISVTESGDLHSLGHSEVLGLDLCWEEGQLRWYDPATGRYLPTFDEEAEARLAAEARVRELEAELERLRNL